jgi:hypothetical protein
VSRTHLDVQKALWRLLKLPNFSEFFFQFSGEAGRLENQIKKFGGFGKDERKVSIGLKFPNAWATEGSAKIKSKLFHFIYYCCR